MAKKNVLIVEDEPMIRLLLVSEVEKFDGLTIYEADNFSDAKNLIEQQSFDFALLDIKFEELSLLPHTTNNGYELASLLPLEVKTGFITSNNLHDNEIAMIKDRVYSVLYKPFKHDQLVDFLQKMFS